jgi:hypothetical protein
VRIVIAEDLFLLRDGLIRLPSAVARASYDSYLADRLRSVADLRLPFDDNATEREGECRGLAA